MAIRVDELQDLARPAAIYRFPLERAPGPARAEARRRAMARRRAVTRRRAALGAVVVALAATMLVAGGPGSVAPAATHAGPRVVTVRPGESLWSLAGRYAPAGFDPRAYVDALTALNHLSGPLQPGTRLRLPR